MLKELNLNENAEWRERFRTPTIAWSSIATQNPKSGLVCTNKDGIYQLYAWDVETGDLKQLTHQPAGVVSGSISADGKYVYYLHDEQGNEIGHYFRIALEDGEALDATPNMPAYASLAFAESHTGKYIGFTAANQEGFQVYAVDREAGGTPHLRYQSERMAIGPVFSYDGELSVIANIDKSETLDFSLEAYETVSGTKLGELWDGKDTSITPIAFSPVADDMRLLAKTNQSGFGRPLIWNPKTGERTDIALPEVAGEISPWGWSSDGKTIILSQLNRAQYQLYRYHIDSGELTKLNHPQGTFSGGYFVENGNIYAHWQDAVNPARLVELNGNTGELVREVLSAGDPPTGIHWQSVDLTSGDGTKLQAWLATPEGEGPFPTIFHTHGGPTAVMTEVFHASAQAWLDHGFAFFSLNYRGSTTFGKEFEKAIYRNLGDLEVEDIAAGVKWLVDNNVALPDSILKTGGSYGGYLTLQSLGKKPDLWAGGMAVVAIADWVLMYEDQAETLRGYQRALFGGTPEETPEAHRKASPLTYADNVTAPLLVIQGSNDTRCPARQMQVYEEKLKSQGKSIHIHWFDAGHGSRAMNEQIEHQEIMLRFAYQVLG